MNRETKHLWLDDSRDCPFIGNWAVARSFNDVINISNIYDFDEIWLDHDLDPSATLGQTPTEKTGYDVLLWLIENDKLPKNEKVYVHSLNPVGAERMCQKLAEYYSQDSETTHRPEKYRFSYLRIRGWDK